MQSSERSRRHRAWVLSFLAYAVYYVGRKGFAVSKKTLVAEQGVSEAALGSIDAAYLIAYAGAQFVNGWLGDRVGARRLLSFGLLGSALACAGFGSARGALAFGLLFFANGLFQATGWPGTTRAMAEWTTVENRGTVMALWSTCYQVGGILANVLCGFLLVHAGWRAAFLGPALLLGLMAATLWFGLPERASVLGAPAGATASAALVAADRAGVGVAQATAEVLEHTRATPFRSPLLWCYGASYFFIKFIRYALLFWLPYYLSTTLLYRADLAASVASAFEVGGIVGVIAIGVLSDRVRVLSRGALSALSLIGLAIALFAYTSLARHGIWLNAVGLACIGALLFGPDALLSGAAAQDAGGVRAAATATGMVNGLGSVGAIVESFVVPHVSGRYGWSALFPMLVLLALGAAAALGPSVLRGRRPVMG